MKGSCLCGAVTYEAGAARLLLSHCSCRTCRRTGEMKLFAEWPPGR